MKRSIIAFISILIGTLFLFPRIVLALDKEADITAQLIRSLSQPEADMRVVKLRTFLSSYNSPAADYAHIFVSEADIYSLDYRWVAMIFGVESTFGRHIPPGSYNGWGWGIPTGAQSGIAFKNWEEGIHEVTRGLATRYVSRGLTTIEEIGPVYAASPAWSTKVKFFMAKFDAFEINNTDVLDVTL